ncbi:MAG: methyl-accepting chemotaxis protein [Actinobacteria bacterium]|nr:methyl-accepting chemotaxis protein [Actinomycetota bacterium]
MSRSRNIKHRIFLISIAGALLSLVIAIPLLTVFTDLGSKHLITGFIVLAVGVFGGGLLVSFLMGQTFESSLKTVIDFSNAVSEGDLSTRLEANTNDVIGRLAAAQNAMVEGLRMIIEKLREASTLVSTTAEELSSSSQGVMASAEEVSSTVEQISKGAESQARAVEQTSQIINEIAKMAASVADQARVSSETARAANEIAQAGSMSAEDAATKMGDMKEAIDSVTTIMEGLGERSMQIGLIVDVITNIADQTNMLALNAAIEASRAGEHGRGFAVVAEEVRGLAEGSRKAAYQIAKMIRDTESETERALRAMDTSKNIVGGSIDVIQSTLDALQNVAQIVEDIAGGAESVYKATEAQRDGSEKVVKAAHDIASIAEQAAAGTEEALAAANEQTASMEEIRASIQELARFSVEVKRLVENFRISPEE